MPGVATWPDSGKPLLAQPQTRSPALDAPTRLGYAPPVTKKPPPSTATSPMSRDERLKAALKANLAKRKAQAKARPKDTA
jgi:hypothetical protein